MNTNRRIAQILVILGTVLFTLGLFSGFLIPLMKNIELGLGAHMAGVTNGMFLIIAGVVWHRLELSRKKSLLACYSVVYGTYANWFFVTLSAIFGTKALAPVHGANDGAAAWEEWLVAIGLLSVSAAIIYACVLMTCGFIQKLRLMENGPD